MLRHLRYVVLAGLAAVPGAGLTAAAQEDGWLIERMAVTIDIQPDGRLSVNDAIDVDFGGLSRHGIYRELDTRLSFDEDRIREYDVDLERVTAADGSRYQVQTSKEGAKTRFRIGDPDRTVSGRQTYRIAYRIAGALNGFSGHDELYWNATGTWQVPIQAATIAVRAPADAIERAACYQGGRGSTEVCGVTVTPSEARFTATRRLDPGEQITVVVALRKGVVPEPAPILRDAPRDFLEYWDTSPAIIGMAAAALVFVVGLATGTWWYVGRDRRFVSVAQLSQEGAEERVPLFGGRPIGVEFEPPDAIRPGQMGVLIDERADTLDVTATIVDLAVRGYLTITEIPKTWWFGSVDWQLERLDKPATDLLPYERIVLGGLFDGLKTRKVSELENKYYDDLARARTALYRDAVERGWFPRSPSTVRALARVAGIVVLIGGVVVTIGLGARWSAALIGLPLVFGGLLIVVLAGAMPRRTARGRRLLNRTLGFVKFIRTGEAGRLEYAERANIFSAYLPYAIVFRCVRKWARAFEDIDLTASTAGWYVGQHQFDASSFASNLGSFSGAVSQSLSSTPGGSGSSGFSGGSAGGGGGGGGGGSW